MVVMLLPASASAGDVFTDVGSNSEHGPAIEALAEAEIVFGYGDGTFGPRNNITRGQIASILARAEGLDPVTPDFSDVPAGSTHAGAIGALVEVGVIQGYEDGTFRPRNDIRRDHMALMIARWLGVEPVADGPFTDVTRYAGEINALYEIGVVNGTSETTFSPDRNLSRGQAASLVHRALEHLDARTVRFATYNTAFSEFRSELGEFLADLESGEDEQIEAIAQVIQHQRPDVVQIGEFDYAGAIDGVDEYAAADAFRANFLEVSQGGEEPITYPYAYVAPVNTGVPSGFDLNRDGETDGPDDAWGFGFYEGQYGMLVLSKYPILEDRIRTFQLFRWADMPGALLPSDPATEEEGDWYAEEILEGFRLSSKSHWDVPVQIGDRVVHTLNAHPTPPAFDGEEQRNVRRNHDEIRLWADYLLPDTSGYLYDDDGQEGGLDGDESFVILGDYNDDPCDGDGDGIYQLLEHPRVNTSVTPASEGGVEQTELQGGINLEHECPPEHDTADFSGPGNLRVDYALPSVDLAITDAAVFWPLVEDPWYEIVDQSDHRMVWVDVRIPG
jgi:hypothetical protein